MIGIAIFSLVTSVIAILIMSKQMLSPEEGYLYVVSGREHTGEDGVKRGYYIAQKSGFIFPIIEQVERLPLTPLSFLVHTTHAYTKDGIVVSIEGEGAVEIIPSIPDVHNAIERFLGQSEENITLVAREILEGNIRGYCVTKNRDEIKEQSDYDIVVASEEDFKKMGLYLKDFRIKHVVVV